MTADEDDEVLKKRHNVVSEWANASFIPFTQLLLILLESYR